MIGEYGAETYAAVFVALYVVRSVLAQHESAFAALPAWLRSELRRIVGRAEQGLPVETTSNNAAEDHAEMVREFSMVLKSKEISIRRSLGSATRCANQIEFVGAVDDG